MRAGSSIGPLLMLQWSLSQSGVGLTFAPEKYEESVLPVTWSLQGP